MSTKEYISDELLAAFIDSNTTHEQSAEVMGFLSDSPEAFEEYHIAAMAANSYGSTEVISYRETIDTTGDSENNSWLLMGFPTYGAGISNSPMLATSIIYH